MRYLIIISIVLFPLFVILDGLPSKEERSQKISNPDTSYYYSFKRLDISQSDIEQLPSDIIYYKNLEELVLSNNPIQGLDANILQLKKLKTLKLNNCPNIDLEQLVNVVKNLGIENLEINNCYITYLPYSLSGCSNLKKLSVSGNFIERFPEELALNGRLEHLDIRNNSIDTLCTDFDAMVWLKYLDISNNPCLSVQNSFRTIAGLQNLETLKISGAVGITNNINDMSNLMALDISNSSLKELPVTFNVPRLKVLNLKNCDQFNYESLGHSLEKLDSLEELELSSQKLTNIGDEILKVRSLTTLKIGNNSLKELPELQKLPNLSSVAIQLNSAVQANNVFETLSKCKELDELDISFSELDALPASISKLRNLKMLDLEGMNLKKYPAGLTELKDLQELNIKGNTFEADKVDALTQKLDKCNIKTDIPYAVPVEMQKELAVAKENFTINTASDNTLKTADGSEIKIPANAFVDKNGKQVKGNVVVSFQPYYTPTEVYMSGISMNYDSAGTHNSFVTAGMFSISATAGENELALSKQKKIQVDFQSNDPGQNYNFYSYNPTTRNWNYKGRDNIKPRDNEVVVNNVNTEEKRVKKMRRPYMRTFSFSQNPTEIHYEKVETRGRRKYQFYVTRGFVNSSISDEVQEYFSSNNTWVYEPDSAGKDFFLHKNGKYKDIFHQTRTSYILRKDHYYLTSSLNTWNNRNGGGNVDIEVIPDRSNDRFTIIFRCKNDSMILTGYPEYRGMPNKVQDQTKKDYEKYLVEREKRKYQEAELFEKYKAELIIYEEEMKRYREYLKELNAKELSQINNKPVTGDRIMRTLILDELGAWNCDIINRMLNGMELLVRLFDNKGNRLSPQSLTVIDRTNNGFGSFGTSKIICDRYVNNVIIAKISNTKYGYVKFCVNSKDAKSLDLDLTVMETKGMTMKQFSDQVFN